MSAIFWSKNAEKAIVSKYNDAMKNQILQTFTALNLINSNASSVTNINEIIIEM